MLVLRGEREEGGREGGKCEDQLDLMMAQI